jgi:hypothetical protein
MTQSREARLAAPLLVALIFASCGGAASTGGVSKTAAVAAYLTAATTYSEATAFTRAKYPGGLTLAQNQALATELAVETRLFGDAVRAIGFPPEMAGDVTILLDRESDLEVLYRVAATVTTVSDNNAAWIKSGQAELAAGQAVNALRGDLGLQSVAIAAHVPPTAMPSAPPSVAVTPTVPPSTAPSTPQTAGVISFGSACDPVTLRITKPTSRFRTTYPKICFSAKLTEPAGASSVNMVIARVLAGGKEMQVWSQDFAVPNQDSGLLAGNLVLAAGQMAGTYAVRFLRGGTVLARGTFQLVK